MRGARAPENNREACVDELLDLSDELRVGGVGGFDELGDKGGLNGFLQPCRDEPAIDEGVGGKSAVQTGVHVREQETGAGFGAESGEHLLVAGQRPTKFLATLVGGCFSRL